MTREEFDKLSITPKDLVCIEVDSYKRIGFIHEAQIDLYTEKGDLFGCFDTVYITNYAGRLQDIGQQELSNCYETVLDWISSIEILKKDFWSEHDQ